LINAGLLIQGATPVSSFIRQGSFHVVRKVSVDEDKLKQIAYLLGLTDDELRQGVSGIIYVGITPPDASTPDSSDGSS